MWNIILGGIFLVGGLTGNLVLIGTQSSGAIAAVGAGLIIWGIFQLRNKNNGG